jgi:hypothetical protein
MQIPGLRLALAGGVAASFLGHRRGVVPGQSQVLGYLGVVWSRLPRPVKGGEKPDTAGPVVGGEPRPCEPVARMRALRCSVRRGTRRPRSSWPGMPSRLEIQSGLGGPCYVE